MYISRIPVSEDFLSAHDTKFYILELQTFYCGDLRRVIYF